MVLLSVRHLSKSYDGNQVLRDVDWDVERGQVFALIGPSGAGKTTLLRLVHLLERPTSGKTYFDGVDTDAPEGARLTLRRRMAMVFQRPVVFHASVYENVAYGLKVRGVRGRRLSSRVSSALETVGLSGLSKRNALTLSGGEVQRVALARAMVTEPELLLLDEPTANLDPGSTRRIEALISRIIRELNTTVIISTHDMVQGQRLANRIGVLLDGTIIQAGTPGEVFGSPQSREIAEFVGVENIFEGPVTSNEEGMIAIDIGGGVIEAFADFAPGEEVCAFIRPEEVVLALAETSTSARNTFFGEIVHMVPSGPLVRVGIDCGFPLSALITRRSAEGLGLSRGSRVCAFFKATGVHVVKKRAP